MFHLMDNFCTENGVAPHPLKLLIYLWSKRSIFALGFPEHGTYLSGNVRNSIRSFDQQKYHEHNSKVRRPSKSPCRN